MAVHEKEKPKIKKLFYKEPSKVYRPDGGAACTPNCDCYVETEYTKAAGIAGYRYGM